MSQSPRKEACAILLADDDDGLAAAMASLLSAHGYVVRVARDGEEAIAVADQIRPRVAILDIGMPRASGHEVARHIRRTRDDSPLLIAVTARALEKDREEARSAGFDHHFPKPPDIAALLALIAARLDSPARGRDAR
jgi:DNA-binding response OmpR family regulator